MKKIINYIAVFFILMASVLAGNIETNYFFDINNGSSLKNVHASVYECSDSDNQCNSVAGGPFFNESSGSNSYVRIEYPGSSDPTDYAEFFFKDGYLPLEFVVFDDWGTGQEYVYDNYFEKAENCHSPVTSFRVVNDVEAYIPVTVAINTSLDAMTTSAFTEVDAPPYFRPDGFDDYYSAETLVEMIIYNSSNATVFNDSITLNLLYDTSEYVEFTWVPTVEGNYTAKVTTTVIDNQCSSTIPDDASKSFHVHETGAPQSECYTLLNNLTTSPQPMWVGETLNISVDKLSNYAYDNSTLSAVPSQILYRVIKQSTLDVVAEEIVTTSANPSPYIYERLYFEFTPSEGGLYTVSITSYANSSLCNGLPNPSETVEETILVKASPELNITSIACFENVIVEHNQSCSVFAESDDSAAGDTGVDIYYTDGSLFGTCTTDNITGGCEAKDVQDATGNFTVYAVASKSDYTSDNDTYPRFDYSVLSRRYTIDDLKVYNDSGFLNEDYDFYRNESFYVQFRAWDLITSQYVTSVVSKATLVSPPGGRANLDEMAMNGEYYRYSLIPIPPTHEFLGVSQVFTFVFNFTNSSGGQAQIDLTIRNNVPEIIGLPTELNDSINFNLSEHEFDVEDKGDDLLWTISGFDSSILDITADGKIVSIDTLDNGTTPVIFILTDLDGDSATHTINFNISAAVNESTNETTPTNNSAPVITSTPVTIAYPGQEYEYDVDAKDAEEDILTYSLLEGPSGMTIRSLSGLIEWTPSLDQEGKFKVIVIVSDGNLTDSQAYYIDSSSPSVEIYPRRKAHINTIRMNGAVYDVVNPGDDLFIDVSFDNWGVYDIEKATIRATVYELGISRRIGPFKGPEADDGMMRTVPLEIPDDAEEGVYTLRMALMINDQLKRTRHRDFRVSED